MTPTEALEEAVRIAGGESQLIAKMRPHLAPDTKLEHGNLYYWRKKARDGVPPQFCAAIESAVEGGITKQHLRPDVFGAAERARAA